MNMLKKLLLLSFLLLVACGDNGSSSEEVIVSESGEVSLPAEGAVAYIWDMKPIDVLVVILGDDFEPLDTLRVIPGKDRLTYQCTYSQYTSSCSIADVNYGFKTSKLLLRCPYLQVISRFPMEGSGKLMEFSQYMKLGTDVGKFQTLSGALAFDRVNQLMKNEGMNFEDAYLQAYVELATAWKMSNPKFEVNYSNQDALNFPFFFCRHFVSDSVFYSDFLELREQFGKTGTFDSTVTLRVADDLLRSYSYSSNGGYADRSRDGSYIFDGFSFITGSLGMKLNKPGSYQHTELPVEEVTDKKSAFYGTRFVYNNDCAVSSEFSHWRKVMPLEDTLGICFRSGVDTVKIYRDVHYICSRETMTWEVAKDFEIVKAYLFGACNIYVPYNRFRMWNDTLYSCTEVRWGEYDWTKFEVDPDTLSASMLQNVVEARALWELGICDSARTDSIYRLKDSALVLCHSKTWHLTTETRNELGNCSSKNMHEKHIYDGKYWSCEPDGFDDVWKEISGAQYYAGDCYSVIRDTVVLADSIYYVCKASCPKNSYCSFGNWERIPDEQLNPPTLNMDRCDSALTGLLKKYDDVYYVCKDSVWKEAEQSLITAPVKDGFICKDTLFGVEKNYDGIYYACGKNHQWNVLNELETARRNVAAENGACDTVQGTSLHWDEKTKTLFGCTKPRFNWSKMTLIGAPFTAPEGITEEKLAGGKFLDATNYSVTIDGTDYVFWRKDSTLSVSKVTVGEMKYDAYFYKSRTFIHSERGSKSTFLTKNLVTDESESFADFINAWQLRSTKSNECRGNYGSTGTPWIRNYNENSYVNWGTAKTFCPEGFHIPDSLEFMTGDFLAYPTNLDSLRNDCPYADRFSLSVSGCPRSNTHIYSILWTSTEKNSGTQYCYEYAYSDAGADSEEKARRIIECPKDVYPAVQAICVKD